MNKQYRSHLKELGDIQVADVIKLNCRNPNQTSFCVSLYGKNAEDIVYLPEKWPTGVVVRPYSPRRVGNNNKQRDRTNYQNRPQYTQKSRRPYQRFQRRTTPRVWNNDVAWNERNSDDTQLERRWYDHGHHGTYSRQYNDNSYEYNNHYQPW